jgi:hypothetical protein
LTSASFYFSKSFCWNFWVYKDASKPQYSWALAIFSYRAHAYLENHKTNKNSAKSPFHKDYIFGGVAIIEGA